MPTFVTDELSFEVSHEFENQSLDTFVSGRGLPEVTLTIARERRSDASLSEQAESLLAELPKALPKSRILGRRTREVGTLDAHEVRVEARAPRGSLYQRLAFVSYYDTLLLFTATSHGHRRRRCDQEADR